MSIEDTTEREKTIKKKIEKTIDMAIKGGRTAALQGVSNYLAEKMSVSLSSGDFGPDFKAYANVLAEIDRMLSIENIYGEE